MDRPATIKDIARELNLSVSTVSRAMRDAPDVSVKTREAVLALSEKLKYHPSRLALSLKDKQTHNIGVLVPNLDYVISTMVKGIDEVALEAGYTVLVCQSNESFGREMVNARRLQDSLVDGFIISVSSETKSFDHIRKIQEKNLPTVIFDRFIPEIEAPSVRIDNPDGGLQATQHLIDQGYKRIAIIAGPKNLGISNSRMEGYLLALKKNKIGHDPSLIIHCNFNQQDAFQATMQLLAMKKRPDAIFTISDRMAIGAFLAIKEKGLKMPKDIGLVGFNNEPITALVTPGISSVEQPSFELGKLAAKLFIETAHNSDNIQQTENILPVKLIIRESSMRKKILTLLPLLLVLGMFCEARKIKVSTQVALTSAAASARPGDTILLKTGEWKNAVIELRCQGTEKNPVVIKAETNGKVWFTGVSSIHLGGSFIVAEGFNFVNGYAGKTAVMEFKAGKDLANNCRITQCTIDDFNNPLRMQENSWVSFSGKNNRLDHCSFVDKKNMGTLLVVNLDTDASRENFHSIDQNYFGRRLPLASNGGEIIRVGLAQHCQFISNTRITGNLFEKCDGETEVISIKSGANIISGNVFDQCQGSVVLRHGDNNIVQENLFFGRGKEATGGVRVINRGQWVINNLFYESRGEGFKAPLSIMNGVPNSPPTRYVQVTDALIANNSFINCSPISLCEGSDKERSLTPANTLFLNNTFANQRDTAVMNIHDDISGISFIGNSRGFETPPVEGEIFTQGFTEIAIPQNLSATFTADTKNAVVISDSIRQVAKSRGVNLPTHSPGFDANSVFTRVLKNATSRAGAGWYRPKVEKKITTNVNCKNATELIRAIESPGAVHINLTGTFYEIDRPLKISKKVTLSGKRQPAIKIKNGHNTSLFIVSGNGSLTIKNISIDGSQIKSKNFIESDSTGSSNHFNLAILNCTITGLSRGQGCENIVFVHKSTLADSILINYCVFQNNSANLIMMTEEIEDKGYYNAEKIVIKRNFFEAHNGFLVHLYRGGVDESTLGPDFLFADNSMDKPVASMPGPLIKITGVQQSQITGNFFMVADTAQTQIVYIDKVRARHLLRKNLLPFHVHKNEYVREQETIKQ